MEFRRATLDEQPGRVAGRAPRARDRARCSTGAATSPRRDDFLLYDVAHDGGGVDEDVFAYSNGSGGVAVAGRLPQPVRRDVGLDPGLGRRSRSRTSDGVEAARARARSPRAWASPTAPADDRWLAFREQRIGARVPAIRRRDPGARPPRARCTRTRPASSGRCASCTTRPGVWRRLAERLGGRGVPSLEEALRDQQLGPVHDALRAAIAEPSRTRAGRTRLGRDAVAEATGTAGDRDGRRGADRRSAPRAAQPVVDGDRRPVAGRPRCASGRSSRRSASLPDGRDGGADEPGLVRGAAAGAGRGRRAARPGPGRGRRPGGRPSGSARCWTCRCRRRWAGARDDAAAAPRRRLARPPGGPPVHPGQRAGTASSGSTASRGTSCSPGWTASSGS